MTPPNFRRAACCWVCAHCTEAPDMDGAEPDYWCDLHGVMVKRMGICDDYAPDNIVTIRPFNLEGGDA